MSNLNLDAEGFSKTPRAHYIGTVQEESLNLNYSPHSSSDFYI